MKKVVFAWELGANLGHLERNLAVALDLRELGIDVMFIVSNLVTAEKVLAPQGFSYLPAPPARPVPRKPRTPINYSELIADFGFEDAQGLRAGVRAWMELWRLLAPDVIITDHAPTAVLAARLAQIPNLPIGPGFCVPLCADPMPAFRVEQRGMEGALRAADARVLPAINEVAKEFGRPAFGSVAAVFDNPNALITSFPELDPFGPRENAHYLGPITAPGRYRKVEWLGQRPRRVFVYLQPDMVGLDTVLKALRQPDIEAICVIPGARDSITRRYQSEGMRILDEPVDLSVLLPTASAVVGYASAGLVSTALVAGVPMLLMPVYLEQELTAECARRAGFAVVVHAKQAFKREDCVAAISAVMGLHFCASPASARRAFANAAAAGLVMSSFLKGHDAQPVIQDSAGPGIS